MHVPGAGSSGAVPGGQGSPALEAEAPVGTHGTMPALVPLLNAAAFPSACTAKLPTYGVAASQLARHCLVPDVYRCFLFKGMDRWLQAVE